jgi:MFS family permease
MGVYSSIGLVSLIVGIFASEYTVGRDKRPFILIVGLAGRLMCLTMVLAVAPWSFILLSGAYQTLSNALIPPSTAQWQSNISPVTRNRLWSQTLIISTVVSMVVAELTGILMDHDPYAYRWLFPLAGVVSMFGIWIQSRLPLRGGYKLTSHPPAATFEGVVLKPIRSFIALLRADRSFAKFENFFFMYGFAFMLLSPVLPAYMVDVAGMQYKQTQLAGGVLYQLGTLIFPPLWGRLLDRTGPYKLCSIIFCILAFYPLTLLGGPLWLKLGVPLPWTVYVAHVIFGAGMSGIAVAWNLAPLSFSGKADASQYTGAHVTLTGVRGMIAPIVGALVLHRLGYPYVFGLAALVFSIAASGMLWLHQGVRRDAEQGTGVQGSAVG